MIRSGNLKDEVEGWSFSSWDHLYSRRAPQATEQKSAPEQVDPCQTSALHRTNAIVPQIKCQRRPFLGQISTSFVDEKGSIRLHDQLRRNEAGAKRARLHAKVKVRAFSTCTKSARAGSGSEYQSGVRHQPTYLSPRLPLVFAHGLFGFDQISLTPAALRKSLPGLSLVYWHGIADSLQRRGMDILIAKVPMSASIEERAESLRVLIKERFAHREINVIGHSMGSLDLRYLASKLDSSFTIRSITSIASPHRGSTFADHMLDHVIGEEMLPKLLSIVEGAGVPGGGRAFACLTTYAMKKFNDMVPDRNDIIYMSWGAACQPGLLHEFRYPWGIVHEAEGPNDGLVSVKSSMWGEYRGTLHASHLDLIGWTNRVASWTSSLGRAHQPFEPRALYLTICEDLALRGL